MELCVKALLLPKQDDTETRISVCKTVSCLLPDDLEVLRACLLTEFLLGPSQQVFICLEEIYLRPDQKYDHERAVIPNSLRCELLLALKAHWPFDPEFWDWKTLKYHCVSLLGLTPESEGEEEEAVYKQDSGKQPEQQGNAANVESEHMNRLSGAVGHEQQSKPQRPDSAPVKEELGTATNKLCCRLCKRSVTDTQIVHHSKRHARDNDHPCPVCLVRFKSRKNLVPHMRQHIQSEGSPSKVDIKTEDFPTQVDEDDDDIEPGEITVDPSLMLYYKSTHDPDVLTHIVEQAKSVREKHADDDEHVTFEYIAQHFNMQNRDEYPCPGTGCARTFKHSKYLYVHLKSEHKGDENVKYFHQMRDKREKCVFCRRHLVSSYHHRKHRRVHYGDQPYTCVVTGCGARFSTSNELVAHKQTHGCHLNYQCELTGCYVTYSDLGQIYHHEAQHFRDAAFTCSGPDCKKYYLSKKEFVEHLSTHGITFSEDDFEAQRKAKRKLTRTVFTAQTHYYSPSISQEIVKGDKLPSPSVTCASSLQPQTATKEPKGSMTLVAVCFDGSKFTCGFEKCGMTFSRARDVQRHLKCAHPEHLKLENKEHKHDKERGSKSKEFKTETEPDLEEKGKNELTTSPVAGKEGSSPVNGKTNSSNPTRHDALKEILMRLSKLDLNCTPSHSSPDEPLLAPPEVGSPPGSPPREVSEKTPVASLPNRPPHLSGEEINLPEHTSAAVRAESHVESLATAKPYVCEAKGCGFRTAQSYSLLRHYHNLHGRTYEQAKRLTSLKSTSFKPYMCQLCSKSHREKHVLKAHYMQAHNYSAAMVERLTCGAARHDASKSTSPADQSDPQHWTDHTPKASDQESPRSDSQHEKKDAGSIENGQSSDNQCPSEEDGEEEAESREEDGGQKAESDNGSAQQVRTTRRLVAKSNLCYMLDKFSKPFHCVAKNCDAAFSTQGGLVRHLQLTHHYNRSQLLLEKDVDVHHSSEMKKEPARKRPLPNSDEPQPQYKCHFANCHASYHLKSSLVRHTRDTHSQPPELIRCKYEGCTKVFTHNDALKKHTLYSHCEYYDSLVVRLQSTHKKSIGCQKKLIVTPQSPHKEEPGPPVTEPGRTSPKPEVIHQPEERGETGHEEKKVPGVKKSRRNSFSRFVFRSHEEALQMCQDRCLPVAYPCMVQDCDSVVMYTRSLQRHYRSVHRMRREDLVKNMDKLTLNAEQLEELIQRKSARPTASGECTPNGVCKMEYQPESENPEGQPAPVSLHTIKAEKQEEEHREPLEFPEEEEEPPPVERNGVLVGADDVLYGEPSTGGHAEESAASTPHKQDEKLSLDQIKPLLRHLTVDLSPPCPLLLTAEEGLQDTCSNKDKPSNRCAPLPVRQPLKRKNELSDQPSNLKDSQPRSASPRPFDIAAYKPIGFESSFLKFIQDTAPKDKNTVLVKRRDAFRRSCSVKENNQLGISHTRSKRSHSSPLKPHATTGDFTSVQNLKSILDKALAGCGDLAIKQLQYLRPVVVLGRPVCTSTLPELFPSDTNNSKLILGS